MSAPRGQWGPPTDRHVRAVLVRHGATEHSLKRAFSGRNALPLSEVGTAQAAGLATRDFGEVAAILASPLRRTVQTAEAIAASTGVAVTIVDDLVETDFGLWEGRTAGEVHAEDPTAMPTWRASLDAAPPGGESFAEVAVRVDRVRALLLERHTGSAVVLVSHVTPIKLLIGSALGDVEAALYRIHLDTASVSVVDFYADGNASVRLVNDTSHLR